MKKKLIKKYQAGGSPRLYNYLPLPPKDKWNGITSIKDLEGNELNPGDLVMATPEGKMVTPDNTLAYLDYMAANNIPILGPTLNQITVTHNNQTGKTTTSLGEDFEDRLKRLLLDPIANDSLLKLLWLEQGELLWKLSHDKHEIDTRIADKIANAKTPEALSIMSPALIGIAAILGFESATAMAAWAAAYPEAFAGIVGTTLGGEIINLATNLGSKGLYHDWGDYANQTWGHRDKSSELEKTLWGFTNFGYTINPLSKGTSAIKEFGKLALDKTISSLNGPWAQRALNTANKYNLGEGVKAGIYNANLSLLYGPEVAAKAGLNHLKLKILDAEWILKNSIRSKDFYDRMHNSSYLNPDLLTYKPSDRADAVKYLLMIENLNKYLGSHARGPKGTIRYTKTVLPDKDVLLGFDIPPALIEVSSSLDYFAHPYYRFVDPMDAKVGLVTSKSFTNALEDEILYGNAANVLALPFTGDTRHVLLFGGMSDLPLKSKEPTPVVNEINELLEGLGHVTGSLITYTNPYATHTPNDVDIITTESNLKNVVEKLLGTITSFPRNHHASVDTPKYGTIDVQIIENAPGGNAKGKIALEIYLKLNPQAYYHNVLETNNYVVPMSPEELLKAHKDNVLKFSNIDLLISGSEKHAQRNLNILRCPDQSVVRNAINTLEDVYKTYLGPDFLSIEDLGVQLNYSNVQNNLEFLNKLGLANSELIAKDPVRMEYLIKSLLYLTHTANRTVAGVYDGYKLTTTDILKAMFTNGSGSNNGGNYARGKFGGDISYGKGDPYIGIVEFPVKHPELLKTPMDVYNYLSKIIDVSEYVRNNYGLLELGNTYDGKFFSRTFIDNIFKDSMLDPETASEAIKAVNPTNIVNPYKTNLSSLVWYTVPNRNENLNIPMYFNWSYNPEIAERLYLFNDNFANILDINHIYSLLPGFNDQFIGRYARYIPNIRSTVVKGSDNRNNYFSGFELPTMSFKSPKVTYESVRPAYELAYSMPSIKPILKARLAAGRNNNAKLNKADNLRRDAYDIVLRLRSALYASIRKTKENFKLATVLGTGGTGIYGISKLINSEKIVSRQAARDIIKDVNYKNKKELKKYLDECEVYLTDELYNTLNDLANNGTLTEFHRELKDILYNYLKNSK